MSRWTADSWWYRQAKRDFLAANTTCWLCGHGGADTIDHIIPASAAPHLRFEVRNWKPAHGVNGCLQCPPNPSRDRRRRGQPRRCNQARGNRLTMTQTRRSRDW